MNTRQLSAQIRKDLSKARGSLLLWSALLILSSALGSVWFLDLFGSSWDRDQISTWNGIIGFLGIALLLSFPIILLSVFYEDAPIRVTAFHLTRPIGSLSLCLSKFILLFLLALVAPAAGGLAGGAHLSGLLDPSALLVAFGSISLALASLTPRWSVLFRLFGGMLLLLIAVQFIGVRAIQANDLGMNWTPTTEPGYWFSLLTLPVCFLVVYCQYRFRKPFFGAVLLVLGMAVVFIVFKYFHLGIGVTDEVSGITDTDVRIELQGTSRGSYNDVDYVSLNYAWEVNNVPSDMAIAPLGSLSEVVGGATQMKQGANGFSDLDRMAADAWGLENLTETGSRQATLLRIPVEDLQRVIVPGASIETTLWFQGIRFGSPKKFPYGETGSMRTAAGKIYVRDWIRQTPNELEIELFQLYRGEDRPVATILVDRNGKTWLDSRGHGIRPGTSPLFHKSRFLSERWRSSSRSKKVDGEWVERQTPSSEWFEDSQLWLGETEETGVFRVRATFPIRDISPDGNWWILPVFVAQHHWPAKPALNVLNLESGRTREIVLKESESVERFEWFPPATLVFAKQDGSVWAVDFDSVDTNPRRMNVREATGEEARILSKD